MEAQKLTAEQVHETLYDGVDVPVRYHQDGRAEVVKVRKIPREEMAQYSILIAAAGGDEAGECAFYVGKPIVWPTSLDDDSFDRVLAEGQRLNFTRFANWFERQSRKIKLVKQHSEILAQATEILERNPILSRLLLGSMNGSSRKDTGTGISGGTPPTS
jgi:hypothetical protein